MKDKIIKSIKISVSLFLMYLLIRQINYAEFKNALSNASIDGIIVIITAYNVSIIINAIKWHLLLPDTEILFLVDLSFRAQFYSTVLPGQLFGEASKVAAWSGRNENMANVTASVIFDKITGIISQIFMGIAGIYFSSIAKEVGNKWILILIAVSGVCCIYLSTEKHVAFTIRRTISFMGKINSRLEAKFLGFYNAWCLFSAKKSLLLKSILWGMINQLSGIIPVWYMSERMGLEIGFIEYCWIMPLMSVILLLPISFAGLGLRDASMASMLSLFNVSVGNSLIISVTMLLAQIAAAAEGGIYILKSILKGKGKE